MHAVIIGGLLPDVHLDFRSGEAGEEPGLEPRPLPRPLPGLQTRPLAAADCDQGEQDQQDKWEHHVDSLYWVSSI